MSVLQGSPSQRKWYTLSCIMIPMIGIRRPGSHSLARTQSDVSLFFLIIKRQKLRQLRSSLTSQVHGQSTSPRNSLNYVCNAWPQNNFLINSVRARGLSKQDAVDPTQWEIVQVTALKMESEPFLVDTEVIMVTHTSTNYGVATLNAI